MADPVCLMCTLLWCCLCSWMVCFRACFHLLSCVWAVLGVTLVRYWNGVVSVCECCVLVLEVCVCKLCLESDQEVEKLTPAVLCLYFGFPGRGGIHWRWVGIFHWLHTERQFSCECCVLVLEVCVCKLCLERKKMKQREADPVCEMCALLWCCLCSWMVCLRVCFHLL